MKPEEAKKAAEAIVLAFARIGAIWQNDPNATEAVIKILTADPAAPVEKEYRAGEWLPQKGNAFFWISTIGGVHKGWWDDTTQSYLYRLSQGNVYPTEAIAEAAKKHAEFWRAFDMADEGGEWGLLMESGKLECVEAIGPDGTPGFQTEENGLAAIERLGGEAYVSEMLTKGRAFRFKWGGG